MSIDQQTVASDARETEIKLIREALQGLRYGSVHVIVQDGIVVQIDRLEKRRLTPGAVAPSPELGSR